MTAQSSQAKNAPSALSVFKFQESNLRIIVIDGDPWFIASDVAKALGYSRPNEAVSAHCKKSKSLIDIDTVNCRDQQNQQLDEKTKVIPESDVYRLTMRSKLESAETLQDWLVEEVLPSIRKTGGYTHQTDLPSPHISEAEATRFKKSVEQHCKSNSKSYPVLYRKVYDYYKITTYKHIPAGKLAEAAQLCGMALVALSKPRMPKEQQVVTMTQAQLDALINERVALALPAPSAEFEPEVLSAIDRRAQFLGLRHYDKIKHQLREAIQKWGKDLRDTVWQLTSCLACLDIAQRKALDSIHALEQETGMEWYGRD